MARIAVRMGIDPMCVLAWPHDVYLAVRDILTGDDRNVDFDALVSSAGPWMDQEGL